jgi:hypothetical protein
MAVDEFVALHERLIWPTRKLLGGGTLGFELVGGRYAELHGSQNLTYSMIATVEERFEMAGVIIFIWGQLTYIAENHREVRFRFDGSHREGTLDGP